jgi:hypothetical protein
MMTRRSDRTPKYRAAVLAGCLLLGSAHPTIAQQNSNTTGSQGPSSAKDSTSFTLVMLADGYVVGARCTMKTYKASDGEKVQLIIAHFRAPAFAEIAHQNLDKMATKIIKQEHVSDTPGRTPRERSVLILPPTKELKGTRTAIVLTRGSDLWEIVSYSGRDAFAFEDQLQWTD